MSIKIPGTITGAKSDPSDKFPLEITPTSADSFMVAIIAEMIDKHAITTRYIGSDNPARLKCDAFTAKSMLSEPIKELRSFGRSVSFMVFTDNYLEGGVGSFSLILLLQILSISNTSGIPEI